jgi:hypothetical protein
MFYSFPGRAWERRSGGFASNFPPIFEADFPRIFEAEPLDIGSQALPGNQLKKTVKKGEK